MSLLWAGRRGDQALCRGVPAWHPASPPGNSTATPPGRSFLPTCVSPCVGAGHAPRAGSVTVTGAKVPPGSRSDGPRIPPGGWGTGPERCRGVSEESPGPVSPLEARRGCHCRRSRVTVRCPPPTYPPCAPVQGARGLSASLSADPRSCCLLCRPLTRRVTGPCLTRRPREAPGASPPGTGSWRGRWHSGTGPFKEPTSRRGPHGSR